MQLRTSAYLPPLINAKVLLVGWARMCMLAAQIPPPPSTHTPSMMYRGAVEALVMLPLLPFKICGFVGAIIALGVLSPLITWGW